MDRGIAPPPAIGCGPCRMELVNTLRIGAPHCTRHLTDLAWIPLSGGGIAGIFNFNTGHGQECIHISTHTGILDSRSLRTQRGRIRCRTKLLTHQCISSKIYHEYIINIKCLCIMAHAMVWDRDKCLVARMDG
jgi:hypothetical protein